MPTYSPFTEADTQYPRSLERLNNEEIGQRINSPTSRIKPWVYLDAIDSVLNIRPDIQLIVADGRSTESVREILLRHNNASGGLPGFNSVCQPAYELKFYPEKTSQWLLFNDVFDKFSFPETKYVVYTSSDVIWTMDWVGEAIKEFEKNPNYQILYPCVGRGDPNLPCQVASGPRDLDPMLPPYQDAAKARVLNAYAMIFRADFLRTWGGYPTLFRNCYTETFLPLLCEAVGGEQRLLPRGWCFHWGAADIWQEKGGSPYFYNEELGTFQTTINKVKMAQGMGLMTKEFLKKTLWK